MTVIDSIVIEKQFKIEPSQLIGYKKFIQEEINNLNGKCLGEYGFIQEITKIISLKQENVFTQNFTGGLIFNVKFEANVINPQIGSCIKMQVVQNKDVFLAKNGPLICIIANSSKLDNIEIGDYVNIIVLIKEINYNSNIIKLVGECMI
jgi:DNA-directed RNA polymerase subunit E'/Rpb7